MSLLRLYLEFFQTGLLAVGGGLAALPFLFMMADNRFVFVQRTGWLSHEDLGNFIAVAQCAPGAIGVNIATQTGFQYAGVPGGILAALGLISPAIIVVSIVSRAMASIKSNAVAQSVFSGLRPAAAGLIAAAGWGVWVLALGNAQADVWFKAVRWREGAIAAVLFLLLAKFGWHPAACIAVGAAAGIMLGL